jgi:hypothetical protein
MLTVQQLRVLRPYCQWLNQFSVGEKELQYTPENWDPEHNQDASIRELHRYSYEDVPDTVTIATWEIYDGDDAPPTILTMWYTGNRLDHAVQLFDTRMNLWFEDGRVQEAR